MGSFLVRFDRSKAGALSGALLLCALEGCAARGGDGAVRTADRITRAIYANDLTSTVADFDEGTKRAVTRSDLGLLSDRMHALGDLKSVTQRSGDPDSGRYVFDAAFSDGMMLVEMRLDPSGKVGAYRIVPEEAAPPPKPPAQG